MIVESWGRPGSQTTQGVDTEKDAEPYYILYMCTTFNDKLLCVNSQASYPPTLRSRDIGVWKLVFPSVFLHFHSLGLFPSYSSLPVFLLPSGCYGVGPGGGLGSARGILGAGRGCPGRSLARQGCPPGLARVPELCTNGFTTALQAHKSTRGRRHEALAIEIRRAVRLRTAHRRVG